MWQIIINVTTLLYELTVNTILFFIVRYIEIEYRNQKKNIYIEIEYQWDKGIMQCIQKICLKNRIGLESIMCQMWMRFKT